MTYVAVVDDNPTVLAQLRTVLGRAGFDSIRCFTDPELALTALVKEPPRLLIIDYSMPKLNGLQLMQRLQHAGLADDFPVAMFSGAVDTQLFKGSAYRAGVHEVLAKPLKFDELILKLKNLSRLASATEPHAPKTDAVITERQFAHDVDDALLQRMLEKVAAVRDENTGRHTSRMAHYAATIAQHHGLNVPRQQELLAAAPLHDIGKLGVPDHILLKPGPFTSEERKIMQRHTTLGYDLLRDEPSPLLQLGAEIAWCHHEQWDGAGYPRGLSGEDIPLSSRIVAIADVFDALTTIRPYKPAWLMERAVAAICAESGRHFDPQVVLSFQRGLGDLQKIKRRFDCEPPCA